MFVHRTDLSDARLLRLVASVPVAIAAWFLARPWLPEPWHVPGSPALYLTGVVGATLLLVSTVFAIAKRSGASRNPVGWFNAHVVCTCIGATLIAIHSGGYLRRPPALLLLALLLLGALGVWARIRGSRQMAATFASKAPAFAPPDAGARERLRELIAEKRHLLTALDPGAREGIFSITLSHWLRAPRRAATYRRLEREEARLLSTRAAVSLCQAWWRPLHMAIAWIFVMGVVIHIVTVTFFAGYVAKGGPITWWHLATW